MTNSPGGTSTSRSPRGLVTRRSSTAKPERSGGRDSAGSSKSHARPGSVPRRSVASMSPCHPEISRQPSPSINPMPHPSCSTPKTTEHRPRTRPDHCMAVSPRQWRSAALQYEGSVRGAQTGCLDDPRPVRTLLGRGPHRPLFSVKRLGQAKIAFSSTLFARRIMGLRVCAPPRGREKAHPACKPATRNHQFFLHRGGRSTTIREIQRVPQASARACPDAARFTNRGDDKGPCHPVASRRSHRC